MTDNNEASELLALTSNIVVAYVSNNSVEASGVVGLIEQVHKTLSGVGQIAEARAEQVPAVSIKKSVFPSYLVCLEDGKKLKMLKRHLATSYQMTPDQYRERWGLPASYPMVAPDYASRRSELAKSIGLGRRAKVADVVAEVLAPAKRGRKKAVAG